MMVALWENGFVVWLFNTSLLLLSLQRETIKVTQTDGVEMESRGNRTLFCIAHLCSFKSLRKCCNSIYLYIWRRRRRRRRKKKVEEEEGQEEEEGGVGQEEEEEEEKGGGGGGQEEEEGKEEKK